MTKKITLIFYMISFSYLLCFSQQIENVEYTFSGGTWKLIRNKFTLDFKTQILTVESYDTSNKVISCKLTNRKVKSILKILNENNLKKIPDSTDCGIDGFNQYLNVKYSNNKIVQKKGFFMSKEFISIDKFFQKYSRRKESDYLLL